MPTAPARRSGRYPATASPSPLRPSARIGVAWSQARSTARPEYGMRPPEPLRPDPGRFWSHPLRRLQSGRQLHCDRIRRRNGLRVGTCTTALLVGNPMRHDAAVNSVAFSSDGSRIVTASDDNTARVWETATGNPVGAPLPHADAVLAAAFDKAGARVVTAAGATIRISACLARRRRPRRIRIARRIGGGRRRVQLWSSRGPCPYAAQQSGIAKTPPGSCREDSGQYHHLHPAPVVVQPATHC